MGKNQKTENNENKKTMYKEKQRKKLHVKITAQRIRRRKILTKGTILIAFGLLTILSLVYGVLYIVNETGNFTISLDPNLRATKNIVISKYEDFRETALDLTADRLEYMDNISVNWLPDNIDDHEGPHNGKDYIGYTFFVKNIGATNSEYEAIIEITSLIKEVDEAIRVMVIKNGEKTIYAKENKITKEPEVGTVRFFSSRLIMREETREMQPDKIDKYTIAIWLEGDDPECNDDILGGEMKLKMIIHELGSE